MTYNPVIHLYKTRLQEETDEAVLSMVLREITKTGVMVDREELMKALRYDRAQYEKGYADGRADAVKWISVKERLPKGLALAVNRRGAMMVGWIEYRSYDKKDGFICLDPDSDVGTGDVTHWMPLPEPPEEEEHATD